MLTKRLLVFGVSLGLLVCFSCAAHSDQGARPDANAQSGNANSAGSEKVTVSAGNASIEVKKTGEDSKSVTIGAGGIDVSKTNEKSADDVVKLDGMNQNLTFECKGRSYRIEGASNTVRLTGECQNLRVAGTSNQVDVEAVATINISGIRNHVTWERGLTNKRPSISNSGINNTVSQKGK